MDNLIKALELSLLNKNWYGSLFIALSIPDICGYLESPTKKSQIRYEEWFKKYLLHKYSSPIGRQKIPHVFLSGSDCYALRCSLFHEGREEIIDQRARQAIDRFYFIEPHPHGMIHCNQFNNVLLLQVDIFCNDILSGLRKWIQDNQGNPDIGTRIGNILKIYPNDSIRI